MSWRRILILTAGFLLLLLAGTGFALQRAGAATTLVRRALAQLLDTDFELGGADLGIATGTLTLRDLRIWPSPLPGAAARAMPPLLHAERVEIGIDTNPLGDLLAVHSVGIDGLEIQLALVDGRLPDFGRLLRLPAREGPSEAPRLPPITLRQGRLQVAPEPGGPALELHAITLQALPLRDGAGTKTANRIELAGQATMPELSRPLELVGSVDLTAGSARLATNLVEQHIDRDLLQRFAAWLPNPLPAGDLGADLRRLSLQLIVDPATEPGARIELDAELDAIDCSIAGLPYPLRGGRLHARASSADDGRVQALFAMDGPRGAIEVTARATGLLHTPAIEVRGHAKGLRIDTDALRALQGFAAGRNIVRALAPTEGTADLELFLRDPGRDSEIVDLDLHLRDVALAYHGFGAEEQRVGFPLPVHGASGHVHLRGPVLSIEDVQAHLPADAGGGEVTLDGRVEFGAGAERDRVSIDLRAPRVSFSPPLRRAFGRLLGDDGALYDEFDPAGSAAVTLRVRPTDGSGSDWQVRVQPLDMELSWRRFPYRLAPVTGEVVAQDGCVELQLEGRHGATRMSARGRLLAPPDAPGAITSGRIELRLHANDIAFDADLRRATTTLAPGIDNVWNELMATGSTDADARVWREHGDEELAYDVRLAVKQGNATPDFLPLPTTSVHGDVFVFGRGSSQRIEIDALRGQVRGDDGSIAELAVVGTVSTAPHHREDIIAVVRDLRLDESLGRALQRNEALTEATWQALQPSGKVDAVCRHQRTDKASPRLHLIVHLRGVTSNASMLPRPATDVSGELEIDGGEVRFANLHALIGGVPVHCLHGHVKPDPGRRQTEIAFVVSAQRFPVDDQLANLFQGPLRQAVLDRQMRGFANIDELSLRFLVPDADGDPASFTTVVQGRVEALGIELLIGTRLEGVRGIVRIDESEVTGIGGSLRGTIGNGAVRFLQHAFEELHAKFTASAEQVSFRDVGCTLHGGAVRAATADREALVYHLPTRMAPDGRVNADLVVQGLRLQQLLQRSGLPNTPYHGTVDGRLTVHDLRGADLVDLDAEGRLSIADAYLGDVPIFTAIYALLPEQDRPRFNNLEASFRVKNRELQLRNLQLRSPLLAVNGKGSMTMEGYLDIVLVLDRLFGGSADLLLLPPVVQLITSNLVRFHLFGHLRDLQAEQRWFAQSDPRRRPLLPLPRHAERPQRPAF